MSSKEEYDANRRARKLRDDSESAMLQFSMRLPDLMERLVCALEKIANKP